MKNWSKTAKLGLAAMIIALAALTLSETVCNTKTDNTRAVLPK